MCLSAALTVVGLVNPAQRPTPGLRSTIWYSQRRRYGSARSKTGLGPLQYSRSATVPRVGSCRLAGSVTTITRRPAAPGTGYAPRPHAPRSRLQDSPCLAETKFSSNTSAHYAARWPNGQADAPGRAAGQGKAYCHAGTERRQAVG